MWYCPQCVRSYINYDATPTSEHNGSLDPRVRTKVLELGLGRGGDTSRCEVSGDPVVLWSDCRHWDGKTECSTLDVSGFLFVVCDFDGGKCETESKQSSRELCYDRGGG